MRCTETTYQGLLHIFMLLYMQEALSNNSIRYQNMLTILFWEGHSNKVNKRAQKYSKHCYVNVPYSRTVGKVGQIVRAPRYCENQQRRHQWSDMKLAEHKNGCIKVCCIIDSTTVSPLSWSWSLWFKLHFENRFGLGWPSHGPSCYKFLSIHNLWPHHDN